MPEIIVYFASDGTATIRMPKGAVPDRDTIERLSKLIREHRKSPAPCGNMEQGSATETVEALVKNDTTTPGAERQDGGHKNG